MSSMMTSSVRKVGLDHFEPDMTDDPHAARKLRGMLEKIDFTAFAANREVVSSIVGKLDIARFQRLALATADARGRWVAEALAISTEGRAAPPERVAKLAQLRIAFEEFSEAYEALRRMIDRGYLPLGE